jgi:hypothetical protein
VQPTKTPYDVAVANERLVSHAGVGLLAELADRLGLTAALEHKPPHPSLAPFKPFGDSAWSSRPGLLACRPCGLIVRSMGRAEMATFYRSIRPIREGIHRLEDVVGDRTLIAVKGVFDGRLVDGTPVAIRFADFFRIRNGLVIERDTYFDAPGV